MKEFDKQMEMVLYHSDDGDISVDAYIKDESLWITQKAMADLFGIDKSGISRHLKKYLRQENWTRKWLLQNLQQPVAMELSRVKRSPER